MTQPTKIVVCCPGNYVTGGPELLHQFVDALRAVGRDAAICYHPFEEHFDTPEAYRGYDVPQVPFEDRPDTLFVIPESATWIVSRIRRGSILIWWMSVDFFFNVARESAWQDFKARVRSLVSKRRQPLFRLKRHRHLVQSHYAHDFLRRHGMASEFLTDYLGASHFAERPARERQDIVVYNPNKGKVKTAALMAAHPQVRFVPIKGMTPAQVAELLASAKIYIDFGHHPGKDRLPREAAMSGCCVITGRRGAARFHEDVPIDARYKLDDGNSGYIRDFGPLVQDVFARFPEHSLRFDAYRERIRGEQAQFREQVRRLFGSSAG